MPGSPRPVASVLSVIPVVDTSKDGKRYADKADQEEEDVYDIAPGGCPAAFGVAVVAYGLVVLVGHGALTAGIGFRPAELDVLEFPVGGNIG